MEGHCDNKTQALFGASAPTLSVFRRNFELAKAEQNRSGDMTTGRCSQCLE